MDSKFNMRGWKVSQLTPSRVDTPEGSISVSWSSNSDGGDRDKKAEEAARLIASAPDLLIELRQSVIQMEMAAECIEKGRYDEALLHVCSLMSYKKATIANATGESA